VIAALVLLVTLGLAVGLLTSIGAGLTLIARMWLFIAKVAVRGLALMVVVTAFFQLLGGG
jgi:hypothetical protein